MRIRKTVLAGAVALAGLGTALSTTGTAHAGSSGSAAVECASGYACLYYNSNFSGAIFRQNAAVANYAGYTFVVSSKGSAGAGSSVKNNAASVDNWDFTYDFTVFYNSNYGGVFQTIGAGGTANLNSSLKNQNASGHFHL
ncbi:peptidase inhibitor family I36 protein [Streptomyces sp. NPDC005955]|uniref:peptidase inhibitor family I36 protein n=1 Tax=Streptomyces sp. NPDC005955 TaxID=3364738 RepID=UPI00367D8C86